MRGGKAGATCSGNGIRALPFGWGRRALPLKLRKPSLDIAPGAPRSCVAAPCHPAHRSGPSAAPCPLSLQPPLESRSSAPRCPRCTKRWERPQLRRRALSSQPLSLSSHAFPASFPGRGLPWTRLGLCSLLLTPPSSPTRLESQSRARVWLGAWVGAGGDPGGTRGSEYAWQQPQRRRSRDFLLALSPLHPQPLPHAEQNSCKIKGKRGRKQKTPAAEEQKTQERREKRSSKTPPCV